MAEETSTEHQNFSSSDGPSPKETLYDKYIKNSTPQPEEKSRKGRCYKFFNFFKATGDGGASSTNNGAAAAATTETTAEGGGEVSNENASRPNIAEGSSSQKRKIPKTYADPPKVRGFEKDEMSLEIMLLKGGNDDSFKTIGVFGLPGVGKTTLCKSIMKNERVKQSYDPRIWVSFSEKKPDTGEETVIETLEHTGVADDIVERICYEHRLPGLLDALKQQLKDRKYLIVFDDVGEGDGDSCYETVKSCFSNNGLPKEKGGAVIVTCRSEEAAKKMVEDISLHRLQPLSDPTSCWLIYKDAMEGRSGDDTPGSKDVMDELLKKCGGLPGAAKMMGEIKRENIVKKRELSRRNSAVVNSATLVN